VVQVEVLSPDSLLLAFLADVNIHVMSVEIMLCSVLEMSLG
jgi:hypothetical protein